MKIRYPIQDCMYAVIVCAVFISGCITTSDSIAIKKDMEALKKDVNLISQRLGGSGMRGQTAGTWVEKKLDTLLENQADMKVELSELKEKIRILEAKVEDRVQNRVGAGEASQGAAASQSTALAKTGISGDLKSGKDAGMAAEDLYKMAYQDYVNGKFDLAIDEFREFIFRFPRNELSDNAQYWIGECYYTKKDFSSAVTEFQKVVADYPGSNKIPGALLKIAYAQLNGGELGQSKQTFEKIIKEYPDSPEAKLAEEKIR